MKLNVQVPGARSGFTLLELLVVIAITVLLIALLLPALSRAREGANRLSCAVNQRSIVMAASVYADDFREFFPRYDVYLRGELLKYLSQSAGDAPVFICPSAKDKPLIWGDWDPAVPYGGVFMPWGPSTYGFNNHLRGNAPSDFWNIYSWWNPGQPVTRAILKRPAIVFVTIDSTSERFDFSYGRYFVSGYRHSNKADPTSDWTIKAGAEGTIASFADGHARWLQWPEWRDWVNSSYPPPQEPFAWY